MKVKIRFQEKPYQILARIIAFALSFNPALCQKLYDESTYAVSAYLRYEMYAGQFPQSSGLPALSSGSILNTGWGFEGMRQSPLHKSKIITFQLGFGVERYKRFYARQGERLRGVDAFVFGSFHSPPVPYDTYYHTQTISLRTGFRISTPNKHPSSLTGGFQLASFMAYFGNSNRTVAYSDRFSDIFVGYYVRAQQDFVFYSQDRPLLALGIFLGSHPLFTAHQDKVIQNFIWQGYHITINEGIHGASPYVVGLTLTL